MLKNFKKRILANVIMLALVPSIAFAYVTQGDINRLKGLVLQGVTSITTAALTSTTATITTLTSTTQTISGVETIAAGGTLASKTSTSATDLNPPYDNRILGNPVLKVVYGSCTVAAVNGGTCIPLAGVTARTITVTNFDIVAAGSAATCTGVKLEDTNGTPVVIATLAAATLTSGSHNVPLTATLGVGFGAGSGLTAAAGVQILVNGSGCTTTTAFQYAISYAVQ